MNEIQVEGVMNERIELIEMESNRTRRALRRKCPPAAKSHQRGEDSYGEDMMLDLLGNTKERETKEYKSGITVIR